ncbi:hypothetical protein [Methylovulum psychrotolerans]|uniref:DNA-binding protein n=1 Tax=Methylovulum psychrotolerans TaxID=1704499 RepID=A0A2S5CGK6_9GAMM|nr:hypothetical protein [Methylovulum psychrotolerans]POZ49872.1 hypothetical protein AADEFJLK_04318 [Methylovulum psychrotolerans]
MVTFNNNLHINKRKMRMVAGISYSSIDNHIGKGTFIPLVGTDERFGDFYESAAFYNWVIQWRAQMNYMKETDAHISSGEIERIYGISPSLTRKYIKQNAFPDKIGKGILTKQNIYDRAAVAAWVAANRPPETLPDVTYGLVIGNFCVGLGNYFTMGKFSAGGCHV